MRLGQAAAILALTGFFGGMALAVFTSSQTLPGAIVFCSFVFGAWSLCVILVSMIGRA